MNVINLPSLQIKPLHQDHLQDASLLLHTGWHRLYDQMLPTDVVQQKSVDHFKQYLLSRIGTCWLAFRGERLVGLITTTSNCVDEIWVSKNHQRKGIGTQLLNRALAHFKDKHFQHAQAGCESFNQSAIHFLEGLEWQEIARETVFIDDTLSINALVFSIRL